jgi:hypothetical protein
VGVPLSKNEVVVKLQLVLSIWPMKQIKHMATIFSSVVMFPAEVSVSVKLLMYKTLDGQSEASSPFQCSQGK